MSDIELLRHQTEELLRALSSVAIQLRLGSRHNGAVIRREIVELARKLDEHCRVEAELLYPELLASKQERRRRLAQSQLRQMADLEHRVARFQQRWPSARQIDEHPEEFAADATRLVLAVKRTLLREASEIYPVARKTA